MKIKCYYKNTTCNYRSYAPVSLHSHTINTHQTRNRPFNVNEIRVPCYSKKALIGFHIMWKCSVFRIFGVLKSLPSYENIETSHSNLCLIISFALKCKQRVFYVCVCARNCCSIVQWGLQKKPHTMHQNSCTCTLGSILTLYTHSLPANFCIILVSFHSFDSNQSVFLRHPSLELTVLSWFFYNKLFVLNSQFWF